MSHDSGVSYSEDAAAEKHQNHDGHQHAHHHHSHKNEEAAAQVIQRNYRGYRERRQLKGMGLDASARWREAVRDARWRNATRPMSRSERSGDERLSTPDQRARAASDAARQNWKRVGEIARRAGGDDPKDSSTDEDNMTEKERAEHKQKKAEQKREREKTAKMMDLQYFLEMVDQKHRYGSNLRTYHEQWKKEKTHENFFYWLDEGGGKNLELPTCSRERLEKEQVRYLSREERMNYLVKIDHEGRLCWAKNGEKICTTVEYKDSVDGIVPKDDSTPAFQNGSINSRRSSTSSSSSTSDSSKAEHSDIEGEHYVNHDLNRAKGVSKIKYVSAAALLNHLLRGSVKPNSWIFVADTSFRLYVGIKQSGAFQHSSFLHGARISAAGLIKIKNGQLRKLSPLSGHYRPPTKNFRAFVHSLRENGVDMSRVSISQSYAVLVGLEAYVKTRRKVKHGVKHVQSAEYKVMHPEEARKKEEDEKDKSKSAEKERKVLAANAEKEEEAKKERSLPRKLWRKLGFKSSGSPKLDAAESKQRKIIISPPGQDAESGIAPEGGR